MSDSDPQSPPPKHSGLSAFWAELKRRNVFKVGVAYAVVAWLLIQVATLLPAFGAPEWVEPVFFAFVILGFPLAVVLAWVYEMTPRGLKATSDVKPAESIARSTSQRLNYVIVGFLVLAVAFLLVDLYVLDKLPSSRSVKPDYQPISSSPVSRTVIRLPEGQRQPRLMNQPIALSPDGTVLAYVARDKTGSHLFIRRLDSFETIKFPGTEFAHGPFFSSDGQWIGFFSAGKLKRVPISGGLPSTIADAPDAVGGSWGENDQIVFAPTMNGGLWRVAANGGTPERLTGPDLGEGNYAHVWPQHLPGGKHVLFTTWGNASAHVLNLETGSWQQIRNLQKSLGHRYVSTGHLLYSQMPGGEGSVLAVPFDLKKFSVSGVAVPVLDDVWIQTGITAHFFMDVSENGTVVYVSHKTGEGILMWVDRDGNTTPIRRDQGVFETVRLSPDGRTIVYRDEKSGLQMVDVVRGTVDLLVSAPGGEGFPVWNPDGEHIVFSSNRAGSWDIYELEIGARNATRPLFIREFDQFPGSISINGRLVAYVELLPETGYDVWLLIDGKESVEVVATGANEFSPAISPDGTLLAYISDETGKPQVYLRTFPEREVKMVSIDGGEEPVWSRDGKELYFRHGDALLSVTVTTKPTLEVSATTTVIEMAFDRSSGHGGWSLPYYDVSTVGERFLVASDRSTTEFKVIHNWFEELNRLVPPTE